MIKINKNFKVEQDFFELNPQLAIVDPFSKLYKLENGSRYAWAAFFMNDPDITKNSLYNLPEEIRKENIINNYFTDDMNWDNEDFQDCLEKYSFVIMSPVERALKEEYESLARRAKLIRETEYTLDRTDENGKKIIGTAKQLDDMRAKTLKIYEGIDKAIALFKKDQEEARVYGGRKESTSEKGLV